jgi:putative endopeptidase
MRLDLVAAGSLTLLVGLAAAGPAASDRYTSGLDPASFDASVRPQDDLYRYVNGRWLATVEMPADRVTYGTFIELADQADADVRAIVEALAGSRPKPGSAAQQIGDLYASMVDEARLEALGDGPIRPELDRIDAIRTPGEMAAEAGHISSVAAGGAFAATVVTDARDPAVRLVQVAQGGAMLPDRDYYLLPDPASAAIRAKYEAYLTTIFTLTGRRDPAGDARHLLALETELARAQWSQLDSRDPVKTANRFTLGELAAAMPGFDWRAWAKPQGIDRVQGLILLQPSFFKRFAELASSVPIETWRAWLAARYITAMAPFLSSGFDLARFEFFGRVLSGQELPRTRWKRGVGMVNGYLGDAVGRLYVERHFPASAKARVEKIVANTREAFRQALKESDWLAPATRREALDKLAKLTTRVGFPDRWQDYNGLVIRRDDLFGNTLRAMRFQNEYRMRRVAELTGSGEWLMTPQTVNAYYTAATNEIVLPAGILQPPLFQLEAEDAANYGAIGAVLGHEVGHAFDERGRTSDGAGKVRDWWTAADGERFATRAAMVVEQFNGFSPLAGMHVNGALTKPEAIGDLAGLQIAWRAYQISLGGRPAPEIDGFSGAQRFFLSWARVWRSKEREDYLRQMLFQNQHPPSEYRANGTVSHLAAFYDAFAVKPGDRLYRDPDRRVTIW